MNTKITEISIEKSTSIIAALKQMDEKKQKLLLVLDEGLFYSLLSIGDIQRAIIANVPLEEPISKILRPEVRVAKDTDEKEQIKAHMRERRNDFMPIVDDNRHVVDVIFWDDLFETKQKKENPELNLPVVIMAGGKGSRLRPLTNVLPKPLIPIGNQTMLEDIMDRFVDSGCNEFYISVNYKAETIKQYFQNLQNPLYKISFFQEEIPLGTAGSLHLLKDKINSTFFVSNCDIIIDEDYAEILRYHKQSGNEITVVAAIKNYTIPYGTLETGNSGRLQSIQEKPDITFKINTGMYILEPHLINEIPANEFYHITSLIDKLIKDDRKVGVFPINEGSWTDIGNWDEYLIATNKYK
jgi:dTDP-glucose pyrophosphorylase